MSLEHTKYRAMIRKVERRTVSGVQALTAWLDKSWVLIYLLGPHPLPPPQLSTVDTYLHNNSATATYVRGVKLAGRALSVCLWRN